MGIQTRVTEGSITTRVLANLQRNMARGGALQEQLSTGKQISRPSDSPTGTITSLALRGEMRSFEQYSRNADDGLGWLGAADNALTQSSGLVNKVRDLALQGLNSGIASPGSREALAAEVDNIYNAMIGLANTTYLDRPIFGGTTTGRSAYDETGAYQGDTGEVMRSVGNSSKVQVQTNGPEAFGDGDTQIFAVLRDISRSLRDNDISTLGGSLNSLDAAGNLLKGKLSDVGARYNHMSRMRESAQDRLVALSSRLSDVEDIDLPKVIMEMQMQKTSYEAALAATAKVIQPSLIDYLR
jgi:flagellar hook-associated protein 3 FlgL